MLQRTTKLLLGALSVIIVAVTSSSITSYAVQKRTVISRMNSELLDMNALVNLVEHLEINYKNDKYLNKEIKHLVLTKILIFSTVKPSLEDLGITQLEGLSRALMFHEAHGLTYGEHETAFQNSLSYLKKVESTVSQLIKERRTTPNKG